MCILQRCKQNVDEQYSGQTEGCKLFIYVDAVREAGSLQGARNVDTVAPKVVLWLTSSHNAGSHRA